MQSIVPQGKVHFYEYMEVELLQEYIHKGLTYFVTALVNASPKLTPLRYFTQEIAVVINFCKDFYYLLKHKATYAEYFFGLERESLLKPDSNKAHSKLRLLLHTAVVTLLPYLANKLQAYFNQLKEEEQNEGKKLNTAQKLLTKVFPYIYALVNITQVLMRFRFLLFQKVKTYDLYYKLSDATLNYIQDEAQSVVHYPWMELFKTPGLLSMLVGHKVLTWYFNHKNFKKPSQTHITHQIKLTSPLQALRNSGSSQPESKLERNSCPICTNRIENPTVVKMTGHVYCYECISEYVKENQACPLSGVKLSPESLQIIYSGN